jgi:hypothetical protein
LRNAELPGWAENPSDSPTQPAFHHENPLVSRDRVAARAVLDDIREVAASHDEPSLRHMSNFAACALMDDLASHDPVAALALLNDILSTFWGLGDSRPLTIWDAQMSSFVNSGVPYWLDKMSRALKARGDASLRNRWAEAAAGLVIRQGLQSGYASFTLTKAMQDTAIEHNEGPLWEWWAKTCSALIIALGSKDLDASRYLVSEMLKAMNDHSVEGRQTMIRDLLLQAGRSLTQELAKNDPAAAKVFCAEVLGLPDEMLQMMRFGD